MLKVYEMVAHTHQAWLVGLLALVVAGGVVTGSDPASSLLVQQALREARLCLQRGEAGTAVRVLERQLPHINGDAAYLELLGQAYEAYLIELHQLGRTDMLPTYLDRLAIINPSRAGSLRERWQVSPVNELAAHRIVARGRMDDEPPLSTVRLEDLLSSADDAFTQGHYPRARLLYWRAYHSGQSLSLLQRQRWAYSILHEVYTRLQQPALNNPYWPVIYSEARHALELVPDWPFAQQIVKEVELRLHGYRLPIQHEAARRGEWYVSRSTHFRIYHQQAGLAERVLVQAEQTLYATTWFWFGELEPPNWTNPCDIYLHPDGQTFARSTGVHPTACGFSTLTHDSHTSGRIVARRIDLNAQAPDLLIRIVPHETTHIALAGRFGDRPLPRWTDEALAILAEPAEYRQHYREQARRACQQKVALPIETLITLEDYPAQFQPAIFYGQSLLLIEYLLQHKGRWNLVHFLAEVRRLGFEPALRQCYGLASLAELAENAWQRNFLPPQNQISQLSAPFAPGMNSNAKSQTLHYGWNRR
jgi:hypothetical protein